MNSGRYIISQLLDLVHWETLSRYAQRYDAEKRVRHFGCRQQLVSMVFAQLTWREALRDIADCLNARPQALYHLGFREPVAKSTLADANELLRATLASYKSAVSCRGAVAKAGGIVM
jgi:hypothetical protein